MENELIGLFGLGSVGLVLALTQVVKPWVNDTRLYPLISIALGIGLNILIGQMTHNGVASSILYGMMAGLSASGLYSFGATLKEGVGAKKKGGK